MRFDAHPRRGIVWFTLALGLLIFAGMVLISFPGIRRMQRDDMRRDCIENLVRIECAKEQYALDQQLKSGAPCSFDLLFKDGKNLKRRPICPAGGKYSVNPIGQLPTCSYPGHVVPVPEKFEDSAEE
ncbi:MAG: hypothetical protein M1457_06795 [bacterium]|nr:hypothetical protein [bacterium]